MGSYEFFLKDLTLYAYQTPVCKNLQVLFICTVVDVSRLVIASACVTSRTMLVEGLWNPWMGFVQTVLHTSVGRSQMSSAVKLCMTRVRSRTCVSQWWCAGGT